MHDWKQILLSIYTPEVGSLWTAPNGIWNNSFASNKDKDDYHPVVVGKVNMDKVSCRIIPGTTKEYQKGSCVYKVKLNPNDLDCPISNFLIKLWMTYSNNNLVKMKRGWNGIDSLNQEQIKELKLQIKFCLGIDV
ncbi:hypothetical protein EZS27_009213 [termite gut metagenome]|uniref:Uncharacterized protein n=1 Tax=termite gut metagenome TaxID=433724 RepID=A0A5J4SBF5_9ZZZZ